MGHMKTTLGTEMFNEKQKKNILKDKMKTIKLTLQCSLSVGLIHSSPPLP